MLLRDMFDLLEKKFGFAHAYVNCVDAHDKKLMFEAKDRGAASTALQGGKETADVTKRTSESDKSEGKKSLREKKRRRKTNATTRVIIKAYATTKRWRMGE